MIFEKQIHGIFISNGHGSVSTTMSLHVTTLRHILTGISCGILQTSAGFPPSQLDKTLTWSFILCAAMTG